ncbi:MAG: hypothetical protein ACFFDF_08325 [Candidatus Odinarchaeota archaeon]
MKNEKLEMKREVWDYFRQYRQASFRKRYQELSKMKEIVKSSLILN